MRMAYCYGCGHHHPGDEPCGAVVYTESGGAKRCYCVHLLCQPPEGGQEATLPA